MGLEACRGGGVVLQKSRIHTIVLSRVDNLGDAMLVLPAAGLIKRSYPDARLLFLGRGYQRAVIDSCHHFDGFLDWEEVWHEPKDAQRAFLADQRIDVIVHIRPRRMIAEAARSAGIPYRIGSSSRFFHLWTCNHRPLQFRKLSKLHEAQLNILLLRPLIGDVDANCDELGPLLGFDRFRQFPSVKQYLDRNRFNLILHPRSNGHSKNWDPRHFAKLIDLLPKARYNIIVTGNQDERREIGPLLLDPYAGLIQDTMGRLSVPELISLCSQADGLVSNSTGPLHVAAGAGIHALGLYNYAYKTRPSRYGPIGPRAETLIYDENCPTCLANKGCDCINLISPERVQATVARWEKLS